MGRLSDLTLPEVPAIEIVLLMRPGVQPLGSGEGSQGPAMQVAYGFSGLPLTPQRVKSALAGPGADTDNTTT